MMRLAVGALAVILSVLAALTHPFTDSADAVTALALAAYAALFAFGATPPGERSLVRLGIGHGSRPAGRVSTVGLIAWLAVIFVAIAFEVANYLLLPRSAHPTVSYFLSFVAAHAWSRGLLFLGWLALGARIVRG